MQVTKSVKQQSCVDGSMMRVLHLDVPVDRDFLAFLGQFGSLLILDETDCSFFTFKWDHVLSIMGFLGDRSIEVKNPKEFQDITDGVFSDLCRVYKGGSYTQQDMKDLIQSVMIKIQEKLDEKPDLQSGRVG